jgi:hypothetical protein
MSTKTSNLGLIKPELTDPADITAMNENWDKIDRTLGELKNPQYVDYTLLASGWSGESTPYTYTIDGYDGKTVEVVESMSMTLAQLSVIENAKIKSDPSSEDNVLYAFGSKPTVDVPVLLIVR